MEKDLLQQSLIPYLDCTAHPFALKIAFPDRLRNSPVNEEGPFIILNQREPLTRLFMGKMVTKTGSAFKDLFLLIQRDNYLLPGDTLSSLTNTRLEDLWQQAFRLLSTKGGEPVTFYGNPADDGKLVPFRSLFHCWFRNLFFHPPCPACGKLLDLCTADDVLQAHNLPAYSSSLNRFLYCPSCLDEGSPAVFFTSRKEESDAPALLDVHDLVREFGKVPEHAEGAFPCPSCPEKASCYGPEGKAAQRIVPFSFFPFYLLVFDSYPVQTIDLLKPDAEIQAEIPVEAAPREDLPAPVEEVEEAAVEEREEDEQALRDILLSIRRKWKADLPKPEKKPEVPEAQEIKEGPKERLKKLPVDMLEKTMIFSPDAMQMNAAPEDGPTEKGSPEEAPPPPPPHEPQLEKTMIFSPGEMEQLSSPGTKAGGKDITPDQLEETMLAGSDTNGHEAKKPVEEKKRTEEIPETIIMSLDELEGKKHDK